MKNSRITYLVVSILALFNVLFLPVYPAPEWVLAETGTSLGFYNAMYMLLRLPDPLNYWTVSFTLAVFVPSIILFVCALIGKQIPFLLSTLAGITLWSVMIWQYIGEYGFKQLFVLDSNGICFGVWIALALFLAAMVLAVRTSDQIE